MKKFILKILICLFIYQNNAKAINPSVYYGAFASDLNSFEANAKKSVAIVNSFKAWGGSWSAFSSSTMDSIRAHGSLPMIIWEPWVPGAGVNQPNYSLQSIVDGTHDAYIKQYATAAKNWKDSPN